MSRGFVRRYKWPITAAVGLLLALSAILLIRSGHVYQHREEINIQTGQARRSQYVLSMKVSEQIAETPLSLALGGELVEAASIEPWHWVNRNTPGGNSSPQYVFHGALDEAAQFELLAKMLDLSPEQKKDMAREILTLWQQAGRVEGSTEYMMSQTKESA